MKFDREVFVYDQLDGKGDRLYQMFENNKTNRGTYMVDHWAYEGIVIQNNHANIDVNGNLNRTVRARHPVWDRENVFSKGAPMQFVGPTNNRAVIRER